MVLVLGRVTCRVSGTAAWKPPSTGTIDKRGCPSVTPSGTVTSNFWAIWLSTMDCCCKTICSDFRLGKHTSQQSGELCSAMEAPAIFIWGRMY